MWLSRRRVARRRKVARPRKALALVDGIAVGRPRPGPVAKRRGNGGTSARARRNRRANRCRDRGCRCRLVCPPLDSRLGLQTSSGRPTGASLFRSLTSAPRRSHAADPISNLLEVRIRASTAHQVPPAQSLETPPPRVAPKSHRASIAQATSLPACAATGDRTVGQLRGSVRSLRGRPIDRSMRAQHVSDELRGLAVGGGRCPRVKRQRHVGRRVAEPSLCGLDVDAGRDERGGSRRSEVVETEVGELRLHARRTPDPSAPVRVVERALVSVHEDESVAIGGGEVAPRQNCRQVLHQPAGCSKRSLACGGLRCRDHTLPGELPTDGDPACEEVHPVDGQPRYLRPSQAEHRAEPHHRAFGRPERLGECRELFRLELRPVDEMDLRQPDTAAGGPHDPFVGLGECEDRAETRVLPSDRGRCFLRCPAVDERLDVRSRDRPDRPIAEDGSQMVVDDGAVSSDGARPSS